MTRKTPETLRSARWFAPDDFRSFGHRSRMNQMGYSRRRLRRQADHRHPQHLVRPQPVPRPFQDPRRGRQARRAAGGRLSRRTAGDVALGEQGQADDHALSQFPRDGDRGTDPLASRRRRRADGRLRQDHARPDAGRDQRRRSRDLRARRADAARQLARQGARLRLGRVQILGRAPRRQHFRQGLVGDGGRHRALLRRLHDDGHGLDHDRARRRDRHEPARRLVDSGRRFQPHPHVRGRRAGASSTWSGRT